MDKLYEKDFGGANYRSRDPIKNFRIRIKLQRLSQSTIGFVSQTGVSDGEAAQTVSSTNQFGQTILDNEELEVKWQQKLFSLREMEFYGFEPNCTSVLDYKYHANVEAIKKSGGRTNGRLFTYLDRDRFYINEDEFVAMTTSPEDIGPTSLARQVAQVRRRKATESSTVPSWKLQKGISVSGMKLVEEKPTQEFQENHHVTTTPMHTMVIMADLSPEGQLGSLEHEHQICKIEYNDNGVIRVSPDFTRSRPPYRIERELLGRDIWEFRVEHVSNTVSKMESRREAKIISELYRKHKNYLHSLVGDSFLEIPDQVLRLNVFGEIVSAESFEYDHLHIEYLTQLPENWSYDPSLAFSGCTHTCSTTLVDNIEMAYFSQPFHFESSYFLENQSDEEPMGWPQIFLHVISLDSWGRRRTEGYGYVTVPTAPGRHEVKVHCWRPTGNGGYDHVAAQRRRFFVGGTPELEDVTYAAVPSTFEGKRLAKYGVRTMSTGTVTLRLHTVQQCRAFQDAAAAMVSRKKLQNALQMAKGNATKDAFHGVMDAFQKARKRMQLARETVPTNIREAAQKTASDKLFGLSTHDKIKNILKKAEKQD